MSRVDLLLPLRVARIRYLFIFEQIPGNLYCTVFVCMCVLFHGEIINCQLHHIIILLKNKFLLLYLSILLFISYILHTIQNKTFVFDQVFHTD